MITRLGLSGLPKGLYGSFVGKVEEVEIRSTVTRLGLYGGPRGLYGDFTGKTAEEVSPLKKVRRFICNTNRMGLR